MRTLRKNYYSDAKETPLILFMQILDGAPYSVLQRNGGILAASPAKLEKAWETIYFQFLDTVRSLEYLHKLSAAKTLLKLNTLKAMLVNIKFNTYLIRDKNIVKLLAAAGIFSKDPNPKQAKVIKLIDSRLKSIELDIKKTEGAVKKVSDAAEGSKNNGLVEALVHLSKAQGYRIDPKETTVLEFAVMVKKAETKKQDGENNGSNRRKGV